jgi:nicotinamidase-related amidase
MRFPDFYQPDKVGTTYRPDITAVVEATSKVDVLHSAEDKRRVLLMLVDPQVDFIHEDGSLSVPGAVDDTRRTIEWIYRNLDRITDIAVSLDSHFSMQIFYPGWWVDGTGNHPEAMTPISAEDIDQGRWQPTVEPNWSRYYVHELQSRAKKTLMIWPYHTMLGTIGHAITPALYEAITFHSEVRQSQVTHLVKGRIAKTEYYSLLEPEVKVPGEPDGTLNSAFLDHMATYDRIYFAGQAKSHCVLESIASIANYEGYQPGLLGKTYLLEDATSAVVHPEIDFDAMADSQYTVFAQRGLNITTTGESIGD